MPFVSSLTSSPTASPALSSTASSAAGMLGKSAMTTAASTSLADKPAATFTSPPPAPSAPASSTTVTLSPQALSLSHSESASASSPASAGAAAAAAPAPASSPSVYDEIKQGIGGAVDDVEDAIGGTARFIGHGVEAVVSGADTLVHGALDLPFALGAEACNAAGAVLDAL